MIPNPTITRESTELLKNSNKSVIQTLLILSELRNNCRTPSKNIAERINIHPYIVREKITEMEKEKLINHTSLLDFNKTEYKVRAVFCFKIKKEKRMMINTILEINQINTFQEIHTFPITQTKIKQKEYYVECLFKTISELADFADTLEELGAKDIKEHYIISELKREEFLANKEYIKKIKNINNKKRDI